MIRHLRFLLRTIDGDVAIRAGHINYCSGIGMGQAHVTLADGHERYAACIGGMVSMLNGECQVAATTWEWKEEIDEERAKKAKERAEERLIRKIFQTESKELPRQSFAEH